MAFVLVDNLLHWSEPVAVVKDCLITELLSNPYQLNVGGQRWTLAWLCASRLGALSYTFYRIAYQPTHSPTWMSAYPQISLVATPTAIKVVASLYRLPCLLQAVLIGALIHLDAQAYNTSITYNFLPPIRCLCSSIISSISRRCTFSASISSGLAR